MRKFWAFFVGVVCLSLPSEARLAPLTYTPPVSRENNEDVPVFYGRLKSTGTWCAFDRATWIKRARYQVTDDGYGWAQYDGQGLRSVTFAHGSEDSYTEDRYFVAAKTQVTKMVRTGHYINDPWASVTFEPDQQGRLRLSASSKLVKQKMEAAGYDPYFIDWDHFSKLAQIPFIGLIENRGAAHVTSSC